MSLLQNIIPGVFLNSIYLEMGEIVQIPPLLRQYEHINSFKNDLIYIKQEILCGMLTSLEAEYFYRKYLTFDGRQTERLIVGKVVT